MDRERGNNSSTLPSGSPPTLQLSDRIAAALRSRANNGLLRELRLPDHTGADFASNDYLGLARPNSAFQRFLTTWLQDHPPNSSGSTGSRLLTGHSAAMVALESQAASFHRAPAALLLSTGYAANVAALSTLPGPHDAVVHDELIHASMHDGLRLCRCRDAMFPFAHNNVTALNSTIAAAAATVSGSVLVVVETVYSMDGDVAPLADILAVATAAELHLSRQVRVIVDEAHAAGLFGPNGEGLVVAQNLQRHPNLLAVVVTFGKAFAAHGAVVLSSATVQDYLLNYARPLIYSTALPPHGVEVLRAAYAFATTDSAHAQRARLWVVVRKFAELAKAQLPSDALPLCTGMSPIQAVLVPGNRRVALAAMQLRTVGLEVYPIRAPTVPRGAERIRVVLHAHNTEEEVERLVMELDKVLMHASAEIARL